MYMKHVLKFIFDRKLRDERREAALHEKEMAREEFKASPQGLAQQITSSPYLDAGFVESFASHEFGKAFYDNETNRSDFIETAKELASVQDFQNLSCGARDLLLDYGGSGSPQVMELLKESSVPRHPRYLAALCRASSAFADFPGNENAIEIWLYDIFGMKAKDSRDILERLIIQESQPQMCAHDNGALRPQNRKGANGRGNSRHGAA
ncbi:MAG: hypothetical protein FWF01_00945 [Alphaproteobacteria bacterium]|nr:hypothetical protein [Alphaproteobacteria bacterium]